MDFKIIAYYLPQYHTIPENDLWWGKGFTEWTRVRQAKPLFAGHVQPKIPYQYYDLANIDAMIMQSNTALKFGLDGFCYYHYWFKGKKLLEKPLEKMLNTPEVKISYCLSWANEPWSRAWDGRPNELLIDQNYGSKNDWIEHIKYLIPFFKDKRYIKIDGMPVFLIYRTQPNNIFDDMISVWEDYLKQYGFSGIYIIETLNSYQTKPALQASRGVVEFEPMYTLRKESLKLHIRVLNKLKRVFKAAFTIISYDKVWQEIITRNMKYGKTRFLGGFVNWDNTPRFKKNATVFIGGTPEKFKEYLKKQALKIDEDTSSIVFINAWNEWAEGNYLEPDNITGLGYLEAIREIKEQ